MVTLKGNGMIQRENEIVDIPENRVRYFGTRGKMLLPSPATIAALIQKVPEHKVITTDLIRKTLTDEFQVDGTCPVTTKNSLLAVARDPEQNVAYWRVLTQNGGLFSNFPGGAESQADRLRKEGFTIDAKGKALKVKQFAESLVHFD